MAKIGVLNLRDNAERGTVISQKLRNCPFCGSKAILVEDKEQYKIFCTKCDAQYGWCEYKDDALHGWNRREGGRDERSN